ncbi:MULTISPECIES: exopolysaccharide Pel transporter PelG [Paenibacillus]|uniref:exopolysaccharide Pel transporter PelG n=1 Tax=Paenibacillus TaxID=44249 RepID=UPI0022B92883|nr:exopolysaccharide Pel transporter PelG [Paenibacillus caseinilyticus]MCZ8519013.1 exopolysaccharide Pel transporter PelG [Paenibacillus caseinilyticus]
MAGIGFKLQKLFREDYASLQMKAYAYASFIAAGPWLISVLTVAVISHLIREYAGLGELESQLFVVTVSYCFIFSQILSGGWQLVVTRFLADHFYLGKLDIITPVFTGISRLVLAVSAAASVCFYWNSPLPFSYKLVSTVLFLTIGQIWLSMVFLSAAKNYKAISWAFVGGSVLSIAFVLLLLRYPLPFAVHREASNMLLGFTFGMLITLCMLAVVLLRTFPSRRMENPYGFLHYADKFPSLLVIGFSYNLGVWMDNILIWFGPASVTVEDTFRFTPVYDNAVFLSYLTVIPSLVLFVVSVETRFYDKYRRFYGYIMNGGTLEMILRAKTRMVEVLWHEMIRMTKLQGIITLFLILVSRYLLSALGYDSLTVEIFRIYSLGAMGSTLMLTLILMMLYFEDRRGALTASLLFFSLNSLFTAGVLPPGLDYYGFNYFLASSIALAYSAWRLLGFLHRIEVQTFVSQGLLERSPRGFFTRLGEKAHHWF